MATRTGTEGDVRELLKQLIRVDFDAVEAFRTAVNKISDPTSELQLTSFLHDHERHIEELGAALWSLNATPPAKGDAKRVLAHGKVVLAALAGDKAILRAMKTNEDDTNTAYEQATSRDDLTPEVRDVLARSMQDERRHRNWIVSRIEQMEAGEATAAHP